MRFPQVLLILPLLAAAGSAASPQPASFDVAVSQAQAEQRAAEAEAVRLQQVAAKAQNSADRVRAEQAAAAQAIEAAEARITAADARLRLTSAVVAAQSQRWAREQQPVASLLAGLAVMGQRPPLLALAERGTADELVKMRILLDTTLPVIRARSARVAAQLDQANRLQRIAAAARAELIGSRQDLVAKRAQFAALEQKTLAVAAASGSQALSAGDVALTVGESLERLQGAEASNRAAQRLAAALAADPPAPVRPVSGDSGGARAPFAYALPVAAPVIEGLASVNDSGVRARGVTFASGRGAAVSAPADGTVRFSGPFRDWDGVVIIDHGGGWMSLLVNVASELRAGDRVSGGQPLGRALGPVEVELSQSGRRVSPALISGSSQSLSKTAKGG